MIKKWKFLAPEKFIKVGVETDGQQDVQIFAIKEMMQKLNVYFSFLSQKGKPLDSEGIRSRSVGGSKHERFMFMLPLFESKKFFFPKELMETDDMKELIHELELTTYLEFKSKHDDGLDCISQLGAANIDFPLEELNVDVMKDTVIQQDILRHNGFFVEDPFFLDDYYADSNSDISGISGYC
jgi:hypothetical protein